MYALFKEGKQISKAHENRDVVVIEAYELGIINESYRTGKFMQDGYEIKEQSK